MEIWISLGIAVATIITNIIISAFNNRKNMALIEYRLRQLEEKQDKHNSIIERTFTLEKDVAVLKEEVTQCRK